MKKLCIYVPTYNHPDAVDYYIKKSIETLRKYDIDLYFGDTTADDSVKQIVESHIKNGNSNLFYIRSKDASEEDIKIAEEKYGAYSPACYKVFSDELFLSENYEYMWLCGDGILLNVESVIHDIFEYIDQQYDIINISDYAELENLEYGENQFIDDASLLYREKIYHMTLYGATILSSKVVKSVNNKSNLHKYLGSGFLYVMSIFEYCAENKFRSVTFMRDAAFLYSPYKAESGWKLKNQSLEVWGKNWVEANKRLPDIYNSDKKYVMKNMSRYCDNLFVWPYFLKHRITGSFKFENVKNNKQYIPYVSNIPVFVFYLASLIPKRLLIAPYNLCKKIKYKIK